MVRVLIYDEDGIEIEGQCRGASWTGGCSRAVSGAPVACAGRKIVVIAADGAAMFELAVEPGATACPLAGLGLPVEVPAAS